MEVTVISDLEYIAGDKVRLRLTRDRGSRFDIDPKGVCVPISDFMHSFGAFTRALGMQSEHDAPTGLNKSWQEWRDLLMKSPRPLALNEDGTSAAGAAVPDESLVAFVEFLNSREIGHEVGEQSFDWHIRRQGVEVRFADESKASKCLKEILNWRRD